MLATSGGGGDLEPEAHEGLDRRAANDGPDLRQQGLERLLGRRYGAFEQRDHAAGDLCQRGGEQVVLVAEVVSLSKLDTPRVSRAVLFGIVFWLAGAMVIRYGAPSGPGRALSFLLTIPLMAAAVALVQGRAASHSVAVVAIATASAAFCDVVALTWFPQLYAAQPGAVLSGTVLLFWGIGWALALACWRR